MKIRAGSFSSPDVFGRAIDDNEVARHNAAAMLGL
jgi:hypothetical protein